MQDSVAPAVSIVVPAYNETGNLAVLTEALAPVLDGESSDWEIIYVDDGSSDATWATIESLHHADPRVKGIRLSRNFGHQSALLAGLWEARGAAVISMDADMQHPPSLVPVLLQHWRAGKQIVKTKREDPKDVPFFKKASSDAFYWLFALLSGVSLESGMADYRLIDQRVLREILRFNEQGLFLRGVVEWVGYHTSVVPYQCAQRYSGQSKYTLKKMLRFAWHGVTSFSLVPLRIGVMMGLLASALSFLATGYAVLSRLVSGSAVPGWASSLAITSFLFGVLFLYLGILGEYLGRVLVEVRQRPRFLVSARIGIRTDAIA